MYPLAASPHRLAYRRGSLGLSLVELMVAMTIGLVTVGTVSWMYMGVSQSHRVQDSVARMQEGARSIFELIGNDLRMAGVTGCSYASQANVINSSAWYQPLLQQPIASSERNGAAGTTTQFSDALRVLRADIWNERIVAAHNSAASTFTMTAPHGFTAGTLLVATDCAHVAVFQASGVSSTTIVHAAAGTPGNVDPDLGVAGAPYVFTAGSRIYPLSATTYFVKNNPAGVPALYRRLPTGAAATDTDEELIEGVEDFQVAFGVDTSATPDGAVDFVDPDADGDPYLTAAQVNSAAVPGATAEEKWARVVSARISLLMRTENGIAPTEQTYTFNGVTVTASDRRLRKVFTHVVKLRNRG